MEQTKTKARIKIKDLPKDMKISKGEMRKVKGGVLSYNISQATPYQMQPLPGASFFWGANLPEPIPWGEVIM